MAQQKNIAILTADNHAVTKTLFEISEDTLLSSFKLSDGELALTAAYATGKKNLFNLSLDEAKNIGTGIGCDVMMIMGTQNFRRSSFKKDVYYEAYAIVFLVNARTGELISWKHLSKEADEAAAADSALIASFKEYVNEIPNTVTKYLSAARPAFDLSIYEIGGGDGSAVRTPLPFRRFSPTTTELARDLRIEAAVDIETAIDEKGYITATRIVRWGGFGLDEEVTATVRKMNFRTAIVGGKAIPARFVLRYNFRIPDPVKE